MDSPSEAQDLTAQGARALAAGDAAGARKLLARAVTGDPAHVPAWLNLAAAARLAGDLPGALEALDGALRTEPRNFMALLGRAALLERQGDTRAAGAAYGVAAACAPPDERLDPATRGALQRGRELHARQQAALEAYVGEAIAPVLTGVDPALALRARTFVELAVRKRPNFRQEPVELFYPGLPALPFYPLDLFPWLGALEAETPAIRAELQALLRGETGPVPYVNYSESLPLDQWRELNRSTRWGAFHLILNGAVVEENAVRCPRTMAALAALPQPQAPGRSPAAMFSVLQPQTRIPPHTGVSNNRLVVHLPLVVPPGCGFRVGGETREWREGEAWVFDDTIEHEAWNLSDEPRIILICDVWSPLLGEADRQVILGVMGAMDAFNGSPQGSSL